MKKYITFLLLFIFISITSCTTLKSQSEIQVFFIEKGKLQYFFPPTEWYPEPETFAFEGDWLFRTFPLENESESRTVFNFSLKYDKLAVGRMPLERVYLVSGAENSRVNCRELEILFSNHKEDRYTSWVPSGEFTEFMLSAEEVELLLIFSGSTDVLLPSAEFDEHRYYFKQVRPDAVSP